MLINILSIRSFPSHQVHSVFHNFFQPCVTARLPKESPSDPSGLGPHFLVSESATAPTADPHAVICRSTESAMTIYSPDFQMAA